jgi:hypothetical protein
VVGIFLDHTKVYDNTNHDILLYKLESYGVSGILNLWLKSYLPQRTQFVSLMQTDCTNFTLNRYSPSSRVILHGVPQGSILGPLVFLLDINHLPLIFQEVNLSCMQMTLIYLLLIEEEVLLHKITFVMQQLEIWFCKNYLILNTEKSMGHII